ncbi:acVLRF1 family peptidyl-tRNA hydrolase [Plantactinospora sp. B6F1]|uniref:acVLRF1 family peptidyl-tRNA hydrolase n=1 Tax=Plantactinospora sp. B6F1 TaxID=3158971 RepID=UPI00102C600D
MNSRPAAGGGRWVDVPPARLARWLDGFAERHGGPPEVATGPDGPRLTAPDGTLAVLHPPPGVPGDGDLPVFLAAVTAPRRLGLLLARKGAVAVGVAQGDRLVVSKVDSRYVQGRTAAGGWSQQRFARRRDNQARAAAADGAELAVRLLLPEVRRLAAVVAGGDRRAVEMILADRRLAPLAALRAERLLDIPEPRHAVLVEAIPAARAVRVLVRDP